MNLVLIVGAGSLLGGICRYVTGLLFMHKFPLSVLPWGTLAANLLGCFLIGIIFVLYLNGNVRDEWKLFFIPGVLGGFTTFSSFSVETIEMLRNGYLTRAFLYAGISVFAGLGATYFGMWIVKNI